MPADILAAADTTAATTLLHDAEITLGTLNKSDSASLGPFTASYNASVSFSGGSVNLTPPNIIEIANCNIHYSLNASFSLDLDDFLPEICFPPICFLFWCTPPLCISWPTITIPFSFSDTATMTADFHLNPHLTGPTWFIDVVINSVPSFSFGAGTAALLLALEAAITPILLAVPFIGPFLALAADAILSAIAIGGVTGFLGDMLTPFVSGLTFTVYKQPKLFPVIPAGGPLDPEVDVTITALGAAVQASDKNELVITASIAG
jgi:hypothetical protein